tara:strand:- start:67 stop:543 length:477 start_codon:yes stop_codon:yes gene_type:complete
MKISNLEYLRACNDKMVADEAERERIADWNRRKAESDERERLRRLKKAEDLLARQKAERDRIEREKAEKARLLAEQREAQRLLWEEARRQAPCIALKKRWGEDAYVDNQGRTHSKKHTYEKAGRRLNNSSANKYFQTQLEGYKYGGCFKDIDLPWGNY